MDMTITVIYGLPAQKDNVLYTPISQKKTSWLFALGVAGPRVERGEEVQIYAI